MRSRCSWQERSAVIPDARDSGAEAIVCIGSGSGAGDVLGAARASMAVAEENEGFVWYTAGVHPHDASGFEAARDIEMLRDHVASGAVAVGECGLDYYRNLAPREGQKVAFAAQLDLAASLHKPVIIHCRDAFADVHDMLETAQLGSDAVLHCWTGGPKWTKRFDALGVTFSFAGPITYTTGDTLRLGAAQAPPDRTVVETDSPYLTPEPFRGSNNEPAHVGYTGSKLAEVWGMSTEEVASRTSAHAARVFRRD
jgi:TatD DNase family protein